MSLSNERRINNLENGNDGVKSANLEEFQVTEGEAKSIGIDTMQEALENPALNEDGKRRLEALCYAEENGYVESAKEFLVDVSTLHRWKNKLKEAGGDPLFLNDARTWKLDEKEDNQEILAKKFPEEKYVSTILHPETDIEYNVVDIDLVKEFIQSKPEYNGQRINQEVVAEVLLERHRDQKVLTREQIKDNDYTPKPLFYYPESVEAATTNIDIADSEFHLPIWELSDSGVFKSRESIHPTESGEELTGFETKAALLLFHPNYGDGRRNKAGQLMIKNPQYDPSNPRSKQRELFSHDLLMKYGILSTLTTIDRNTRRTLREGLAAELPHLLENEELFLSDIRQVMHDSENVKLEEYEAKTVSPSAYVMFGAVNQYVGRRFAGDLAKPFSDQRAAVTRDINSEQVLVAAFNLVSRENANTENKDKNGRPMRRANADKTQPKEIKYEKLVPKGQVGLPGALRESKIRDIQRLVTDRFTDLVTEASRAEELVASEADDMPESQKVELADRVKSLLLQQAEKVVDLAVAATDAESLIEDLKTYTFDKRAFTSLIQSLGVEAMLSDPLREVTSAELTAMEKDRMVKLLQNNYEALYPDDEHEEFRTTIENSLIKSFGNSTTRYFLLEDNGEIVSFNRFDEVEDDSGRTITYFGSFNADPEYRGVGSEMLEKTIAKQMQNSEVMFAHSDPKVAISQKYIEDGFVATQTETIAGNFSFEIWRSGSVEDDFETKQMSKEDLISLANMSPDPEDDYFVREVKSDDSFEELDSGLSYVLTRYFTHAGKIYVAFELNTQVSKDFMLKNKIPELEKAA